MPADACEQGRSCLPLRARDHEHVAEGPLVPIHRARWKPPRDRRWREQPLAHPALAEGRSRKADIRHPDLGRKRTERQAQLRQPERHDDIGPELDAERLS